MKHFSPDDDLRDYISERLRLMRRMNELDAAGAEIPPELFARERSLRTKKVRILNEIIFQAMADLTFFFEAVALHPELQETLDSDIKDLLGVRRNSPEEYGFMFRRLLRSILIIKDKKAEQWPTDKRDDFRLKLNSALQGIVLDKANPFLLSAFKNSKVEHTVLEDLAKAWAWTDILAIVKEYGEPHRTFNFDSNELVKIDKV